MASKSQNSNMGKVTKGQKVPGTAGAGAWRESQKHKPATKG
jgi:hypothetical protein